MSHSRPTPSSSSRLCPTPDGASQIQRIAVRTAEVGGVPIARALPTRERRTVGAWCFLDHAGPTVFNGDDPGMDVGPHPHTGLQTFTWMIEGEVLHRDSLGSEQLIRPGQVNLMTAGRGIAHTEQSAGKQRRCMPRSCGLRCRRNTPIWRRDLTTTRICRNGWTAMLITGYWSVNLVNIVRRCLRFRQ